MEVDSVARWLAVGGFLINAIGLLFVFWRTRRRVSVRAENSRIFHNGEDLGSRLSVVALNEAYRPISIVGFSIDFSNGGTLSTGVSYVADSDGLIGLIERTGDSDVLPAPLNDGEFATVYFDYDRIGGFLSKLDDDVVFKDIYAYDAANRKHKAKVPKYLRKNINGLRAKFKDST